MAIEISIPIEDAEAEELAMICEALGMTIEVYLSDTVNQAIASHRIRYQNHLARMAAMAARSSGTGVKIVDAATKQSISLGKKDK